MELEHTFPKAPQDDKLLLGWLEAQDVESQKQLTEKQLSEYFKDAAQPRHASGNACIKLCYFIEQCCRSKSDFVKEFAWSSGTCLQLYNFYLEWHEKNQNRSMRQIIELVSTLINKNPSPEVAEKTKQKILHRNLLIIAQKGAQPLVKPAFKSSESFLAKRTASPQDFIDAYVAIRAAEDQKVVLHDISLQVAWDELIRLCFRWMSFPDISPGAGKFLVTIFRDLRSKNQTTDHVNASSWQVWIKKGLEQDPDILENVKNYLFPALFKVDREGSLRLLEELNDSELSSDGSSLELDAQALLYLAAIDVGKKSGLVQDASLIEPQKMAKKKMSFITLDETPFASLLVHTSETVRSLGLSVLVHSASPIKPFTTKTLNIFKANFYVLFSDTDAKFRNDVLSSVKYMCERLRGATSFMTRESLHMESRSVTDLSSQDEPFSKLLEKHVSFINWFISFLLDELVPTASYQRHITALKALELLLDSGITRTFNSTATPRVADNDTIWPFSINFFTPETLRLLLDLVLDPFEDVRIAAIALLRLTPATTWTEVNYRTISVSQLQPNGSGTFERLPEDKYSLSNGHIQKFDSSKDLLGELLGSATEASKRTGRADYADGVARIQELIFHLLPTPSQQMVLLDRLLAELETGLSTAETDLGQAVHDAPLHGIFASIALIWNSMNHRKENTIGESQTQMNKLQFRVFEACSRTWEAVNNVLCGQSPEGHILPESPEQIDTKDVISYSYRAIHESSHLLRTVAEGMKYSFASSKPTRDIFADIGDLTFEQLSTLRHSGAFATVSSTFARICQLTHDLIAVETADKVDLLDRYYKGALSCINDQVSTTRRSAGIPALITGILSANAKSPSFEEVMAHLKNLSSHPVIMSTLDETNLPQVHAMNCLKDIFRSSVLGKRADSHVTDALQIASTSLKSDIWAIRNCGIILLKSLIDCLFGSSESKLAMEAGWDGKSVKLAYDKYQALPDLLLSLLTSELSSEAADIRPQIGSVESVFPALDIIRRAGPPDINRQEIYDQACVHLGGRVWHIREIAARTVASLLLGDDWTSRMQGLLKSADSSTNHHHGVLMAINFFLDRQMTLDVTVLLDSATTIAEVLLPSNFAGVFADLPSQIQVTRTQIYNTLLLIIRSTEEWTSTSLKSVFDRILDLDLLAVLEDSLGQQSQDALLQLVLVRHAIIVTAIQNDSIVLWKLLKLVAQFSVDLTLGALDYISETWIIDTEHMSCIAEAYVQVIEHTKSAEVRARAATDLADLLDCAFDGTDVTKGILWQIDHLPALLQQDTQTPNLANAQLRLSGWALLKEFIFDETPSVSPRLETWCRMLRNAGDSYNDFDARFAAAATLRSFFAYSKLRTIPIKPFMLPALFALYDTLNDDDDEIRDIGAETVSYMLQKNLVPLAAQVEFLSWLATKYRQDPDASILLDHVICRITSTVDIAQTSLKSIDAQLEISLQQDNALFVQEEQNLFIDEVREHTQMVNLLSSLLSLNTSLVTSNTMQMFSLWTLQSLKVLNSLAKPDKPFGWTSKPATFAICYRILHASRALLGIAAGTEEKDLGERPEPWLGAIGEELRKIKNVEGLHPTLMSIVKEAINGGAERRWVVEGASKRRKEDL